MILLVDFVLIQSDFESQFQMKQNLNLGGELSVDLMLFDGKAVLHIVDTAICFSAATVLDANCESYGPTLYGMLQGFVIVWCTMYSGYPNRRCTDQGSIFACRLWKQLSDMAAVKLKLPGVIELSYLGFENYSKNCYAACPERISGLLKYTAKICSLIGQ